MKALSIRQPWAWAILNAGKRIENRSRVDGRMPGMCLHRGPLLIHASKGLTLVEYGSAGLFMAGRDLATFQGSQTKGPSVPGPDALPRGGIVGVCNVVAHVDPDGTVWRSPDGTHMGTPPEGGPLDFRWHIRGSYGLVLADVRPLPFVPFKGALGFFEVPDSLVPEAFRGVDSAARRGKSG